jgi:hypothetical protein
MWMVAASALIFVWALNALFGELNWSWIASGLIGTVAVIIYIHGLDYVRRRWLYKNEQAVAEERAERSEGTLLLCLGSPFMAVWLFIMVVIVFGVVAILSNAFWLAGIGVLVGLSCACTWIMGRRRRPTG